MSSVLISKDKEISEELILLRRMVQLLSQQNAVDQANRQRVIVDNVANISGGALSSVTTLSSVTNIAAMAGEGVRMFEVPARNCYSNSIRNKLSFG